VDSLGSLRVVFLVLSLAAPCFSCGDVHSKPVDGQPAKIEVTTSLPPGAKVPSLFMELYRGPEPGDWTTTAGTPAKPQRNLSILLPEATGHWLLRVDSRPAAIGSYSIALHLAGKPLTGRFDADSVDRYEGDDSWFQASPLKLGEVQGHSLGPSSNPRGDEDWFVIKLASDQPESSATP
jgi:hypothetical protein